MRTPHERNDYRLWAALATFWVAALAFCLRTLTLLDDQFGRISPGRQILVFGELPFRDYLDPGYFLTEFSSAAVQWLFGQNLLGELLLNAVFIATGFAFASWASRIPQVRDRLVLDPSQLGLVLLAIAAGSLIALPLSGVIVGHVGSRWTVLSMALLDAVADNLEAHLATLDMRAEVSRHEQAAYVDLARQHRELAARLGATAEQMAGYRDLPMAEHDPAALASPAVMEAFERFAAAERDLLALMEERVRWSEAMLAAARDADQPRS